MGRAASGWSCLWAGLLVGGAVIFTDLPVDMTVTRTREQSSLLTWWRSPEAASGRWVRVREMGERSARLMGVREVDEG